jgi:hypothetical protein
MRRWKRLLPINAAAVVGITISVFLVPDGTPLWIWGIVALLVLFLANILAVTQVKPAVPPAIYSARGVWIWLGLAILIIDLFLSHYFK